MRSRLDRGGEHGDPTSPRWDNSHHQRPPSADGRSGPHDAFGFYLDRPNADRDLAVSVRGPLEGEDEGAAPMIDLYRKKAFSTRAC